MNQENRSDPMVEIFPRITKCTFHKYGASGSIQKHDALCVLALNILNEKIYIFLWFWFILLAVLSACAIIYSALVVMLPTTREAIIKRRFRNGTTNEVEGLISNIQVNRPKTITLFQNRMEIFQFRVSCLWIAGWRLFATSFTRPKYQCECIFGDITWAMQSPEFIDPIRTITHGNVPRNGTVLQFGTWKWEGNDDIVKRRSD